MASGNESPPLSTEDSPLLSETTATTGSSTDSADSHQSKTSTLLRVHCWNRCDRLGCGVRIFGENYQRRRVGKVAAAKGVDGQPYHTLWMTSGLPRWARALSPTHFQDMPLCRPFTVPWTDLKISGECDLSFLGVLASCLVVAVGGYHMFGSVVDDRITISLAESSSAEMAMTCLMRSTAFSKFTLVTFPLALGIEEIFAPYVSDELRCSAEFDHPCVGSGHFCSVL
jgi:hypothetical protein